MNISYNWLKDYLDFTLAPAKVSELMYSRWYTETPREMLAENAEEVKAETGE